MPTDPIPRTMQAVVYRGVNDLCVETVPVPRCGAREVLVKVAACGVCPTDIKKIQHGTVPAPRILGHETAGKLVKVGARVEGWRVGDRVALHHHVPCLDCHACRHGAYAQCPQYLRTGITAGFEPAGGGYAEYVRVMRFCLPGLVKIPRKNSFLEGAMLEPANTVFKAVNRLNLLPGDSVMVAGQGPIGLMFTGLLAARGMRVVATDFMASRRKMARRYGARQALAPDSAEVAKVIRSATRGRGLDAAVVAVPVEAAVQQAQAQMRGGGQVLLFAHTRRGERGPVEYADICVDEKDLIGSYSSDFTLQREVARWVFSRRLDVRPLITHTLPLAQTAEAVKLAAQPTPQSLKVAVVQD
tara:strand:+ start:71 stop:1141 length:1071 start_codon:yes stop_codon:yes gene_type:complete